MKISKRNWFDTLNEALASENLIEYWPLGRNINYGENASFIISGKFISVYRETNGKYERPIHYDV